MYATTEKLAKMRTAHTGRKHVVVERPHGISVVSERVAILCNYSLIV